MYSDQVKLNRELLIEAIQGEIDAIPYYEELANMARDAEDAKIIRQIRKDEIKHLNAFAQLYQMIFHKEPPKVYSKPLKINSFLDGVKSSIVDEIEAYELYRNICLGNKEEPTLHIFIEAMTDENEHSIRLNYIYIKQFET